MTQKVATSADRRFRSSTDSNDSTSRVAGRSETAGSCGQSIQRPLLTVIVPVFNERTTLAELVRSVIDAPFAKQIIVVDDGSTDGSDQCIRQLTRTFPEIERYRHPTNLGKGMAIRTALAHALGRYTLIQDADLEYDPQDYSILLQPLLNGEADVVYGSRYLTPVRPGRIRRPVAELGIRALNLVVRVIHGARITDQATCYKVHRTELLRRLELGCERFEFCAEVTAKVLRLGAEIKEVPIHYTPRSRAEGKKIRIRDGWRALRTLWKYRRWTPTGSVVELLSSSPKNATNS